MGETGMVHTMYLGKSPGSMVPALTRKPRQGGWDTKACTCSCAGHGLHRKPSQGDSGESGNPCWLCLLSSVPPKPSRGMISVQRRGTYS